MSWTRLLPIWRTHPTYHALRHWHSTTEQVHNAWRSRYRSGGKSLAERPKRVSRAGHQLRASAALLIEWLRLSFRQGWFGDRGRHAEPVLTEGGRVARGVARARERLGRERRVAARRRAVGNPATGPPAANAPQPAAAATDDIEDRPF